MRGAALLWHALTENLKHMAVRIVKVDACGHTMVKNFGNLHPAFAEEVIVAAQVVHAGSLQHHAEVLELLALAHALLCRKQRNVVIAEAETQEDAALVWPILGRTGDNLHVEHDQETGAVVYTKLTAKEKDKESFRAGCPYDIPRINTETGEVVKCDMCIDRVKAGMLPACVLTCPTGAMNFGDRDEMLALAEQNLTKAQVKFPDAELIDVDEVRVIYLVQTDSASYFEFLSADASSIQKGPMSRKQFLAKLGRPVKRMTS